MIVVAIDPGTRESAFVSFDGVSVLEHYKCDNTNLWTNLVYGAYANTSQPVALVVEEIESFGMAVGKEVFRTVRWSGFFEGKWHPRPTHWMPRRTVKMHLCQSARAKDANIRQALLDRFGGSEAIGKKKTPGPLYGVKGDEFSALAVAVTFWDQRIVNGTVQPLTDAEPTAVGQTSEF